MSDINRGDTVSIAPAALGILKRAYPDLGAADVLTVTRVDRTRGRKCFYLRRANRVDPIVAWPEQVRLVSRLVPTPPTTRGKRP